MMRRGIVYNNSDQLSMGGTPWQMGAKTSLCRRTTDLISIELCRYPVVLRRRVTPSDANELPHMMLMKLKHVSLVTKRLTSTLC